MVALMHGWRDSAGLVLINGMDFTVVPSMILDTMYMRISQHKILLFPDNEIVQGKLIPGYSQQIHLVFSSQKVCMEERELNLPVHPFKSNQATTSSVAHLILLLQVTRIAFMVPTISGRTVP